MNQKTIDEGKLVIKVHVAINEFRNARFLINMERDTSIIVINYAIQGPFPYMIL